MTSASSNRMPGIWQGLLWALRSPANGGGVSRSRLAWRMLNALLWHASAMKRWMTVVYELRSRGIITDLPGEFVRAARPHVRRDTEFNERVVQLIDHADWFEAAFARGALEQITAGRALVLLELPVPRGYDYLRLQLQRAPLQSPEGELLLTLTLQRAAEVQLTPEVEVAAVGFSRFRVDGMGCLVIGGVRGQRHPVHRVSQVEMSRAMAGWKPSVLMVRVAQELANAWHLQLIGLDPSSHRLQGWTSQLNERKRETARRIYTSYDGLWEHFGTRKGPLGWVVLPLDSDEKLEATALSPEKREQQTRRADFWIRTRKVLRSQLRNVLQKPGKDARLSRNTQSMHPPDWERSDHTSLSRAEEDMVPSALSDSAPGALN